MNLKNIIFGSIPQTKYLFYMQIHSQLGIHAQMQAFNRCPVKPQKRRDSLHDA